jgi:splicing factor U2AF subunit
MRELQKKLLEEQQRQALAQQWLLQNPGAAGAGSNLSANRKQREVYVGNLLSGVTTNEVLKDLFNVLMAQALPHCVEHGEPVININMDSSQKFGFIEFRTEELATCAINLDKMDVAGRQMNIGRPKGYVEPPPGYKPSKEPCSIGAHYNPNLGAVSVQTGLRPATIAAQRQAFSVAQDAKRQLDDMANGTSLGPNVPSNVLCIENTLPLDQLRDSTHLEDAELDVREECGRHGSVLGVCIPTTPPSGASKSRVYVKFAAALQAEAAMRALDGRLFDDNAVRAQCVSAEAYDAAIAGGW